jgi:hypothetical protein
VTSQVISPREVAGGDPAARGAERGRYSGLGQYANETDSQRREGTTLNERTSL